MSAIVRLMAEDGGGLAADLRAASFKVETHGAGDGATVLVTLMQTAEAAIAAAREFAEAEAGAEVHRLIIHAWHVPGVSSWQTSRHAAIMAAFTRYAAAAWAGRRVRVNAVSMASADDGAGLLHDDFVATLRAILRWPSMTGQLVHLAAAAPPRDFSPGCSDRPPLPHQGRSLRL